MREGRAKCRWPGQRHWMTQDGARGYCEGSQPWVKVDPFTALYIYLLWDQGGHYNYLLYEFTYGR